MPFVIGLLIIGLILGVPSRFAMRHAFAPAARGDTASAWSLSIMAVCTALVLAPLFPAWAQTDQRIGWYNGTHSTMGEVSIGGYTAMSRSSDLNNREVAYFEGGQLESATQEYDQAIRLEPISLNPPVKHRSAHLIINNFGASRDQQSAAHPALSEEIRPLPLPAEVTKALIEHGGELLSTGDIVAARLAYERAANSSRAAATGVAKTYDPLFLTQTGVRGLRGDPVRAALWYGKAAAAGDREAQQRLTRLRALFPQ